MSMPEHWFTRLRHWTHKAWVWHYRFLKGVAIPVLQRGMRNVCVLSGQIHFHNHDVLVLKVSWKSPSWRRWCSRWIDTRVFLCLKVLNVTEDTQYSLETYSIKDIVYVLISESFLVYRRVCINLHWSWLSVWQGTVTTAWRMNTEHRSICHHLESQQLSQCYRIDWRSSLKWTNGVKESLWF